MAQLPEISTKPTSVDYLKSGLAFVRHNLNQVFAGKFVYFIIGAVVLFLIFAVVSALDDPTPPGAEAIYFFLMAPGALLMLYPSTFSIQADVDSHMIETVFGIPDYRYKVWLIRNLVQYVVIALVLCGLATFCRYGLADIDVIPMVFHLMFTIFFLSSLGFMLSTITKSGIGAAVLLLLIGLVFLILSESLYGSRWNVFHNPYMVVDPYEIALLKEATIYNRVYLLIGGILCQMMAMLRLQRRERFV